MSLTLRSWQSRFRDDVRQHQGDDYLLVACPAAGKTIAAGVAAADLMRSRDCDQLLVVCPTVVVRDQWQLELEQLGFRMGKHFTGSGWPEWQHGVCGTYQQAGQRIEAIQRACQQRRTVVIFDEIHHAGELQSWGESIAAAFADAIFRLSLSGTPFRSDKTRIPFIGYDAEGRCKPDFAYDYGRAVADGACRPIRFQAHDGHISWEEDDATRTATFGDRIPKQDRGRRLRASLDPTKPYLRAMLASAQAELDELRQRVPDAAGLVICDSQAHALAIDGILCELAGELPTIAMSDLPRAHQAIRRFGDQDDKWLVSVRMVTEGVDIPRLGVIVWATAARTELLVRQVAGRALRGRDEFAALPATVHMPADPNLIAYAEQLDVLAGISITARPPDGRSGRHNGNRTIAYAQEAGVRSIDPLPFVEWFDRQANAYGAVHVLNRCGLGEEAGYRALHRWRCEGSQAHTFAIYDACHIAGVDFNELYSDERFAEHRAFIAHPDLADARQLDFGAVEAHPNGGPQLIAPTLPAVRPRRAPGRKVEVVTPELPPSPADVADAAERHTQGRGDVLKLLNVYAQLRRAVEPGYQVAAAHRELTAAVGPVGADSPDEQLEEALRWLRERAAAVAADHPREVVELARAQRRGQLALERH